MIRVLWTWGVSAASAIGDAVIGWVNNFRIRTPEVRGMTAKPMIGRHMMGED